MVRRRNLRKPANLGAFRAAASAVGNNATVRPLSPDETPPKGGQVYTLKREDSLLEPLFPRWTPVLVAVVTFIIRVVYVCQKKNWWILHPDEVYQGVEVAHSELYGYGFRMYEYLPPPDSLLTPAEDQEINLGLYSLRSFIYPHIYTICFSIIGLVNSNLNLYVVGRLIHVTMSSTLPLAVYRLSNVIYNNHDISVLAAIFVATSLHLTIFGTHTLINSFLSPIFIYCLAEIFSLARRHQKEVSDHHNGDVGKVEEKTQDKVPNGKPASGKPGDAFRRNAWNFIDATCGFVLGILCYLRVDLLLFLSVSVSGWFIVAVRGQDCQKVVLRSLLTVIIGATCAICLGGILDFLYFGGWFLSPYQWVTFNVLKGLSSRIFGSGHFYDYLKNLSSVPSAVFLNICALCIVPYVCWSTNRKTVIFRTPLVFLGSTMSVMFTAYSFQSHKETRMLHNVFVLQAMVWAGSVRATLGAMGSGLSLPIRRISCVLVTCVVFLNISDCYRNFPTSSNKSNKIWTFNGHWDSGSVNECLDHLRQQNDVTGLFLDYTLYAMGGFSTLRKDVPLIVKLHHEYYEFDTNDLPNYRQNIPPRLRLVNRLSDVMYVRHTKYILGKLLNNTHYNYIITRHVKRFRPLGFTNTHNCSDFRVLKFIPRPQNESIISRMRLAKDLQSSPYGANATILEYEGSWLFTVGMYRKAVDRLHAAINVNASRIRPYQMLSLSYSNMDMMTKANDVEQQCFDLHTFGKCIEPQPRIMLSEDYNLDV